MKVVTIRIIALVLCAAAVFGLAAFLMLVPGRAVKPNANGVVASTVIIEMAEDFSVTADEFFYYALMSRSSFTDQYGPEMFEIYPSLQDTVLFQVDDLVIGNSAFVMWGREEGFELTAEDVAEFDDYFEEMKTSLLAGGKRIDAYLKENNLTAELFRRIYLRDAYVDKFLNEHLTSEHPLLAVSETQFGKYIVENGVLAAKHILLLFENYDSPEKCRLAAEKLLDKLEEGEDFDTLMWENTDDQSGLSANPDGYTFRRGEFVPEFEAAARLLDVGQMSGLVESDYGYHIILRTQADREQVKAWIQQAIIDEIKLEYERRLDPRTTEARDNLILLDMRPVV